MALRRAAALEALGRRAAAVEALGEHWGGALHLVFRERGDAAEPTALAAEERRARDALARLEDPLEQRSPVYGVGAVSTTTTIAPGASRPLPAAVDGAFI